jgi:excisionase family DNA binding protein
MTTTEASARLNISYDFVLRLLRLGKIKGRRVGTKWVVDQGSVDAYLLKSADRRARRMNGHRRVM